MKHSTARKALLIALAVSLAAALPKGAAAQQWALGPDVSFSTGGMGWTPVDTAIAAVSHYTVRDGGYLRMGYGFSLDTHYYFLLPERESAVWAYAGLDLLSSAATGFSPGGASETTGPYRDYRRVYANLGLQQVLLGDRRHARNYLMLSLGDVSRYVMPAAAAGESAAPGAYFTHSPNADLSFNLGSRKAFMEVLSLSGGVGATLEAGHAAGRSPWAFLMADARLGFKLPLAGKYLYLSASASMKALAANYTPASAIPAWGYAEYGSPASCDAGVDLKSRLFQFDPLVTIAIEPGIGVGGSFEAASLYELKPLEFKPVARAFVDFAVDASPQYTVRLRVGANYDLASKSFSFLLTTL